MSIKIMLTAFALMFITSGWMFITEDADAATTLAYGDIEIDTIICNHYAVTRVSAEMENDGSTSREIQFSIKVPDDAMLSNMSLTIDEVTSYARVVEKEDAEQEYSDAKENGSTATKISGTSDPTLFSVTLNIDANSTVELSITYEQLIIKEMGSYRFELPFGTFSNVRSFSALDVDIDVRTMGNITDITSDKGSVLPIQNDISPTHIMFTHTSTSIDESDHIVIEYSEKAPPINGTIETHINDNGGYFMHVFSPQLNELGSYLPKDIVFILDRSGSMEGRKMEQMKDAFGEIVHQLKPEDDFDLITFASDVTPYETMLMPATEQNMDDAENYIDQIQATSSTNINQALLDGLSMFPQGGEALPIIVFLTDGLPTEGVTHIPMIRENVRNSNSQRVSIYSLGFGDDVDFDFLSALSLENDGYAVKIQETTDASKKMQGFYDTISIPLLMDLYFTYTGGSFEILPTYVPSLFEGSETVVVGRFDPTKERIVSTVTAQTSEGQRVFEQSYEVKASEDMDFIPRLWAFRMIRELQDQILVQGETDELKQDIIDLALEYSFITPYTSFILVIEDHDPLEGPLMEGDTSVNDDGYEQDDDAPGFNIGIGSDKDGDSWERYYDDDDDNDMDDSGYSFYPNVEDEDKTTLSNGLPIILLLIVPISIVLIILLIVFGYSRIRKEHLLEQENRKKIYETILEKPSIHFRGLQREVDLEVGVMSHHLNVLEKEQLIISEQDGNNRRFWCAGVKHDDNKVRLSKIQENILKSIEGDPGITQSQIAKEIGVSRKVVFYHVKFLSNAGVVREEKEKRFTHYYSRE
ncbi:MAG: VWA domain-containing protein [Candidatus Thermoplasmatota archaeon]|nr:VWA domain-containing protein [Candidatus Thermoplasmatota archaeon]